VDERGKETQAMQQWRGQSGNARAAVQAQPKLMLLRGDLALQPLGQEK